MKKKEISRKTKRRLSLLCLLTFILAAYLGYNIYDYAHKINKNYSQKAELNKELSNLLDDETVLKSEIIKLEDPEYVAKFAREKYLYSKDGEIIFRIIK